MPTSVSAGDWIMKRFAVAVLVIFLAGCSSAPSLRDSSLRHRQPCASFSPYPRLKARLDALLPDTLFPPSSIGLKVRSMKTGETLYELNPDALFNPASNEKLFTSAASLALLGRGYRFQTTVFCDTSSSKIVLRGGGDPLLSPADLDSLASLLVRTLPRGRAWTLAGDASFFDDIPWGRGWMWDDEPDPTGMQISSLSINGNVVRLEVLPGLAAGDSLRVSMVPQTSYIRIQNGGTTVAADSAPSLKITRRWWENHNTVSVTGNLPLRDTTVSSRITVWDPPRFCLSLLQDRLTERGIACNGMALDTVTTRRVVLGVISHDLDTVLTFMNKNSDNLSAECLLKTMGAVTRGTPGTADSGIAAVRGFLGSHTLDTSRLVIAEGSGVSRYDLASAGAIVQLLSVMHENTWLFPEFYQSLPIAGVVGTLRRRMRGTAAEGNLHGKTGTLQGASALSGYVTTANGEMLAFSILMQNYAGQAAAYREVQDRIGLLLSTLNRKDF